MFKRKTLLKIAAVGLAALMVIPLAIGCSQSTPAVEKVAEVRLVGTIGPMVIPLAYMQENNRLASVAEKTTLTIWENTDQLKAIITGGQGDFVSLPSNAAATFYTKGIAMTLLNNSIWNILYVVSSDPAIKTVADLKGKEVIVPFQGAIPDAQFRFICSRQGVDPDKDLTIYYAPSPVQAAQLMLSGEKTISLLSEPSATTVIQKGQSMGLTFYRNLNVAEQWDIATGGREKTPVAGTIALGSIRENRAVVDAFEEQYAAAVAWMIANPEAAGQLGARVLAAQGFTAAALTESIQYTAWEYVTAHDARSDLEHFFTQLMQYNAAYVGGKLPDGAFYYELPVTA